MEIRKGHRTALSSRLVVLDQTLSEFERWARGQVTVSVLYQEEDNLSSDQCERILAEVAAAREILARLREALALKPERLKVRQAIATRCSMLWELLTELEPRYLKRYGPLTLEAAEYLGEKVRQLQQRVEAMGRRVKGKGESGSQGRH